MSEQWTWNVQLVDTWESTDCFAFKVRLLADLAFISCFDQMLGGRKTRERVKSVQRGHDLRPSDAKSYNSSLTIGFL